LLDEVIGAVRREGVLVGDLTLPGLSVAEVEELVGDTRADLAAGRFIQESAQAHLARVTGKSARSPTKKSVKKRAA